MTILFKQTQCVLALLFAAALAAGPAFAGQDEGHGDKHGDKAQKHAQKHAEKAEKHAQKNAEKAEKHAGRELNVPILHLAQLLGAAAGIREDELKFKRHVVRLSPQVQDKLLRPEGAAVAGD